MRLPLPTDLITRDGTVTKDAKLVNSFIDGEDVYKRPNAQGGVAVGTGTAQGGIFFGSLFLVNGDVLAPYTGGGTNWNAGTTYGVGDMVSLNFVNYWAINSNTNSQPPNGNWSTTPTFYTPPIITAYATWNPLDKTNTAILSNGNKTVLLSTSIAPEAGVRSTLGKSSGKWYWELTMSAGTYSSISDNIFSAVATLADPNNYPFGDWPNGWSYVTGANLITTPCPCKYNNTTPASYGTSYTIGDIIGCALDMDAGTIRFYKNGVDQGIAYSGLTGTVYAGMSFISTGSRTLTVIANFGASAFAYSVPGGFNHGLYI